MPCLVWQSEEPRKDDQRRMTKGGLLRKTDDLSFLSPFKDGIETPGNDYLYECQTSFVVTGWDISSWTAFCLADSYFADETDPDDPVMLAHYVKDVDSDEPGLDPLSTGKLTVDKVAPTDPREYFLVVVRYRVMRLLEIWTNVEFQLGEKIHQYVSKSTGGIRAGQSHPVKVRHGQSEVVI